MKLNLSTGTGVFIASVLISISIVFSALILDSSNRKIAYKLSDVVSTLKKQNKELESLSRLSPSDFNKSTYDYLIKMCINNSKVGFGSNDRKRYKHCMNEILNTNIN